MQIEFIASMASEPVKLQFFAMERSLRSVNRDLELRVIPYDQKLFDLPRGSSWWLDKEVERWLSSHQTHPTMRKYQCLLHQDYQFVDADVILLKDPCKVLADLDGFVTSCTEWNKPAWTFTPASEAFLYSKSSTWHQQVFSTGQFASDAALYTTRGLIETAESEAYRQACLEFSVHEQPGLNQLVLGAGIKITNLTLPPHKIQSTWAGDYPGEYQHLWADEARKPYLIHWAGPTLGWDRPINEIFYSFLTRAERAEWDEQQRLRRFKAAAAYRAGLSVPGRAYYDAKRLVKWVLGKAGVPADRFGSARRTAMGGSA